jgi:aminoglycoside phosphotransferase (APT) family kinase protein
LAAIADRYHIPAEDIVPAPAPGAANFVYFLGDHLVLRIPRGGGSRLAELAKEATVIPVARRAGVHTPAVVTYDDSCSVVGVPYLVVERVPGRDLAALALEPAAAAGAYHHVGVSLARLHRLTRSSVGSLPGLRIDEEADPRPAVTRLAERRYIDLDAARWLLEWMDRLAEWRPVDVEPVVVHGDAAPTNIVPASGAASRAMLVDWGDAAWADPAVDFAKVPLRAVPYVLEGYLAETGVRVRRDVVHAWAARALWYHLSWAVHRLPDQPGLEERTWTAPPMSRMLEILRFFASGPPEPWRSLV